VQVATIQPDRLPCSKGTIPPAGGVAAHQISDGGGGESAAGIGMAGQGAKTEQGASTRIRSKLSLEFALAVAASVLCC